MQTPSNSSLCTSPSFLTEPTCLHRTSRTHGSRLLALLVICLLSAAFCAPLRAQQDELQYTKEVGGGIGLNFMLSDLNHKWYRQSRPSAEFLMRFILSPRMAVKTTLGYNAVKGSTQGIGEFYPATPGQVSPTPLSYSMKGGIIDLQALYELHFLPYGWYSNYLGHKRLTPYLQLGLGFCYGTPGRAFTMTLPMGFGIKYKVARRLNLGLDWTMNFSLSDGLDGLKAATGISSNGFHGKDFYSKTMFTITYDISPKCPTCNKAD